VLIFIGFSCFNQADIVVAEQVWLAKQLCQWPLSAVLLTLAAIACYYDKTVLCCLIFIISLSACVRVHCVSTVH